MRITRLALVLVSLSACGSDPAPPSSCVELTNASRVPHGSPDGHPDPAGARAAGQARAGRITSAAQVHQAADAPHAVRVGDYLLANDKIAMYIESARASDGYTPYGGEITGIDRVGTDGLPVGASQFGESVLAINGQIIAPDQVTVIADGSDGGPAIVRASGVQKTLPFLDTFSAIFGDHYSMPAAVDYVLAPGAEKVLVRFHYLNTRTALIDLAGNDLLGFFNQFRGQTFTDVAGYGSLVGVSPKFVAWDAGRSAFAFRPAAGRKMTYQLTLQGFELFFGSGGTLPGCQETIIDYAEIIPADNLDALRETIRRIDGEVAHRAVTVSVRDAAAAPLAGALVHVVGSDGTYATRAATGVDGNALVHVPPGEVALSVTSPGYDSPPAQALASTATTATLTLGANGVIEVQAKEAGSLLALPVRAQVLPVVPVTAPSAAFGVEGMGGFGRLHQAFTETGLARFVVPAGDHRVVVSRGFEYELDDRVVSVAAGATVKVDALLAHSVDTTQTLCADFHIHSNFSMDSRDPVLAKVKGALAEGLDLPISSEHDYVVDFQPIIEQLGMTKWAHSFPSEELTTFTYGHFGIIPKLRVEDAPNRGAIDWSNKTAAELFGIVRALPEQPALVVNHPYSLSFLGYFTTATFDLTSATGDPSIYSADFDALEVFNESSFSMNRDKSVAAWFSLLNHGKRLSSLGASDSHTMVSSPLGYPRTCLRLGYDDPALVTTNAVRDAIKRGESSVSGGLYLTVEGPGGTRPGGTIPAAAGMLAFDVKVQAPAWVNAQTLEVIVDGESVQTLTLTPTVVPGPAKTWDALVDITVPAAMPPGGFHWVVFHASGNQDLAPVVPGGRPFAVSNPIYF